MLRLVRGGLYRRWPSSLPDWSRWTARLHVIETSSQGDDQAKTRKHPRREIGRRGPAEQHFCSLEVKGEMNWPSVSNSLLRTFDAAGSTQNGRLCSSRLHFAMSHIRPPNANLCVRASSRCKARAHGVCPVVDKENNREYTCLRFADGHEMILSLRRRDNASIR